MAWHTIYVEAYAAAIEQLKRTSRRGVLASYDTLEATLQAVVINPRRFTGPDCAAVSALVRVLWPRNPDWISCPT
jgi:hypothetical protein